MLESGALPASRISGISSITSNLEKKLHEDHDSQLDDRFRDARALRRCGGRQDPGVLGRTGQYHAAGRKRADDPARRSVRRRSSSAKGRPANGWPAAISFPGPRATSRPTRSRRPTTRRSSRWPIVYQGQPDLDLSQRRALCILPGQQHRSAGLHRQHGRLRPAACGARRPARRCRVRLRMPESTTGR